jgi:GTP-binding protein
VAYALWGLQDRGEVFVHPGAELYEGMIVGVNNKGSDMIVNAIKGKKQTNIRAAGSDDAIQLTPPREMTLEFALVFVEGDELVEVTPKNIRLRKLHLGHNERKQAAKRVVGG